jgi:hypothetical protein
VFLLCTPFCLQQQVKDYIFLLNLEKKILHQLLIIVSQPLTVSQMRASYASNCEPNACTLQPHLLTHTLVRNGHNINLILIVLVQRCKDSTFHLKLPPESLMPLPLSLLPYLCVPLV